MNAFFDYIKSLFTLVFTKPLNVPEYGAIFADYSQDFGVWL